MHKMSNKKKSEGISYWSSYSDMMAALILVFSLIILLTIYLGTKQFDEQRREITAQQEAAAKAEEAAEKAKELYDGLLGELEKTRGELEKTSGELDEIVGVRKDIIEKLLHEFGEEGDIVIDSETGDVMLQSTILYDVNKSFLKDDGQLFLDDFVPRYIQILMSDGIKEHISDVIIEGHTDPNNTYSYNMKLSQDRARSVAEYCIDENNGVLTPEQIEYFESVLSVNGKSESELIYSDPDKKEVDYDKSRRVVIKFRLSDDGQVEKILDMLQNKLNAEVETVNE